MRRGLRLAVAMAIAALSASFLLATAGDVAACSAPPSNGTPNATFC